MEEIRHNITNLLGTKKTLIINEHYISYKGVTLSTNEIEGYRYGLEWISLDVTFGRKYLIYIRSTDKRIIKINIRSFFGKKVDACHTIYAEIVHALYDFYFIDIINNYLNKYGSLESFRINNVIFSNEGLEVKNLREGSQFIIWEDIRSKNYYSYFSIHSLRDPARLNFAFNYLEDWNAAVIYSVVRSILRARGIESYD